MFSNSVVQAWDSRNIFGVLGTVNRDAIAVCPTCNIKEFYPSVTQEKQPNQPLCLLKHQSYSAL